MCTTPCMIPFADTMIRGREPAKGKDGIIQLLDYNLERFDFEDKKGESIIRAVETVQRLIRLESSLSLVASGLEIAMYTS